MKKAANNPYNEFENKPKRSRRLVNRFYSSNYAYTDSNYVISGLPNKVINDEKTYSVLCVLENIIQRGLPTKLSPYLSKAFSSNTEEEYLHLFSKSIPEMQTVIKGYDLGGINPAMDFYFKVLPKCFPNYPFLPQLFVPEVPITDIVDLADSEFSEQTVDFYFPQAKLVLEIDGSQHREYTQSFLDKRRDQFLESQGIRVCRITTSDISNKEKVRKSLWSFLSEYKSLLDRMALDYNRCLELQASDYNTLKCTAAIRLQIALIELCKAGVLSLKDKEWHLHISDCEVQDFEFYAVEDCIQWLSILCILAEVRFNKPRVFIHHSRQERPNAISIKMSLLERPTPVNVVGEYDLFIYTAWRQDLNYYQVATANKIKYTFDNADIAVETLGANESASLTKREALKCILSILFGFKDFRPGQERIIMNALELNDTIGLLPTGSGKSLCYQLAAMLQPCISFVVCPIKSLMIDQDQNLKAVSVSRTQFLSSDLTPKERDLVQREYSSLRYWWVFLSPERFQSTSFREYLLALINEQGFQFGYGVIDEVHCMSEWGHSFRVSYLNLVNTIRNYCPAITLLGLTATASYNVLKNVMIEFGMKDRNNVISIPSFTRAELDFEVITTHSDKYSVLKAVLDRYQKYYPQLLTSQDNTRMGLIFTTAVNAGNGCFELSRRLSKDYGSDIRCYSGTKPKKWISENEEQEDWDVHKRVVQDGFKTNQFPLLVATKAFGMGIDKPNIRYTIHYGLPSSLEALYQEAGRAGRDRKKARCSVLYNPEAKEIANEIEHVLSQYSTAEEMHEFLSKNNRRLNDVGIHLYFLDNELKTDEEVYSLDTRILNEYLRYTNSDGVIIYCSDVDEDLESLQKAIYHLSIIGVIKDWTVDWKLNSVCVYPNDYTGESVYDTTEKYIQNYEPDYRLYDDEAQLSKVEKGFGSLSKIERALHIFWNWYKRSILYSRKEALKNTIEACNEFDPKNAAEFKNRMEAYFRLDDVADAFGILADDPNNIEEWFNAFNIERIEKSGLNNMLMNMNRFLESYGTNTALNYISGLLNLLTDRFETYNGEQRLCEALTKINQYDNEKKTKILENTLIIIKAKANAKEKELFSTCLMKNFKYKDLEMVLYRELQDNASLKRILGKSFSHLKRIINRINLEVTNG